MMLVTSSSAARPPRNPFRMAAPTVDKNDPFAHAHPMVKFCYIGAVTILFVAVATLAFATLLNNNNNPTPVADGAANTGGSVADTAIKITHYYNAAQQHLRTRGGGATSSTENGNQKVEQPLMMNHPVTSSSISSSPSVPLTAAQQQRREGGGVQGQARVVVVSSGENNHNGEKQVVHVNPAVPNRSNPDDEDDEQETIPDDEVDEDLILDHQDLIILQQQANAFGVNKKILGAAKEEVQKEIREAHRNSDYLDFGHDDQGSAALDSFRRRQHQQDTSQSSSSKQLLQERRAETENQENANDNSPNRQQHNVVKLIRRRGDTPVTVSTGNLDVKRTSDKEEVNSIHNAESVHEQTRLSAEQAENEERPMVVTRHKHASSIDAAAVTDIA